MVPCLESHNVPQLWISCCQLCVDPKISKPKENHKLISSSSSRRQSFYFRYRWIRTQKWTMGYGVHTHVLGLIIFPHANLKKMIVFMKVQHICLVIVSTCIHCVLVIIFVSCAYMTLFVLRFPSVSMNWLSCRVCFLCCVAYFGLGANLQFEYFPPVTFTLAL